MKILVTPTSLQPGKNEEALSLLKSFSEDLIFNPTDRPLTEAELIPLLKNCEGFIAGLDHVTKNVLESCPSLKAISRYGAGYDRVDIETAKKLGILVSNTPGVNAQAVGELTFGLILAVARNIPQLHAETIEGHWTRSVGIELKGKTLGLIGLGAIGKVVAQCAQGFSMRVMAYDPFIDAEYCRENKITACSFDELITSSNIISLHLPLNKATHHLIDAKVIERLPKGSIIVNASRGGILDEDAAYEAIKSGQLKGLGLDAFEIEPPEKSPLFHLPHVVTTPHTGAHTKEATENMAKSSIENLILMLSGEPCPSIIS